MGDGLGGVEGSQEEGKGDVQAHLNTLNLTKAEQKRMLVKGIALKVLEKVEQEDFHKLKSEV